MFRPWVASVLAVVMAPTAVTSLGALCVCAEAGDRGMTTVWNACSMAVAKGCEEWA